MSTSHGLARTRRRPLAAGCLATRRASCSQIPLRGRFVFDQRKADVRAIMLCISEMTAPFCFHTTAREGVTLMTQLSQLYRHAFLLALLLAAFTAQAAGLPDTGQTFCYNDTDRDSVPVYFSNSIARDAGTHPRQDCRYGRDAAAAVGMLTKIGAGTDGFDYSKIANNGSTLAATATLGSNATDWACTRDNITGLTWEVKTTSGAGNMASTYFWYNTDSTTNGGNQGSAPFGNTSCNGTLTSCDTQSYVNYALFSRLCNANNWRLPTERELLTLVRVEGNSPSIDPDFFPNTQEAPFWTASTYVPNPQYAWTVNFNVLYEINSDVTYKGTPHYVRLVRGVPF